MQKLGPGQDQPDGTEEKKPNMAWQEQLHGTSQQHPRCSGQQHPGRDRAPAAGAHRKGVWLGSPGAVQGRTVPAGGLVTPQGLVETPLTAPTQPILQGPVVAAMVPQDQQVPLRLNGLGVWGWEPPWASLPPELFTN